MCFRLAACLSSWLSLFLPAPLGSVCLCVHVCVSACVWVAMCCLAFKFVWVCASLFVCCLICVFARLIDRFMACLSTGCVISVFGYLFACLLALCCHSIICDYLLYILHIFMRIDLYYAVLSSRHRVAEGH